MSTRDVLARTTCAEQIRLHGKSLHILPVAMVTVATVLVSALWPQPAPQMLLAWMGAVALSVLGHVVLHRMQREAVARQPDDPRWRRHHRIAVALHGAVWASLALLMLQMPEGPSHDAMAMASMAMVTGWVMTGSFDRVATSWFCGLTALPAAVHVWDDSLWDSAPATGAMLLLTGLMFLTVQRGHQGFNTFVTRKVERERAQAQARLLEQLLQNTEQGAWFLDNSGITTDLNAAMCRLLGRPRQEVLGRSVFDFFTGSDLAILHQQLELRKQGHKEGYEIGIMRTEGSRVECFNNATPM